MSATDSSKGSGGDLERWWQEHADLDRLVNALSESTASRSAPAASAALEDLAEALDAHFAVEEEVYFPLVESLRPELAPTVQKARLTHVELRAQVDWIRKHLRDGDWPPVREALGQLLDLLHSHEEMEAGLIAGLR